MRLIDADKLDWWYKGRNIRRVIDDAPTVDAVVVTRCKDCKHYRQPSDCDLFDGLVESSPEAFCSYGEPKEGAT